MTLTYSSYLSLPGLLEAVGLEGLDVDRDFQSGAGGCESVDDLAGDVDDVTGIAFRITRH